MFYVAKVKIRKPDGIGVEELKSAAKSNKSACATRLRQAATIFTRCPFRQIVFSFRNIYESQLWFKEGLDNTFKMPDEPGTLSVKLSAHPITLMCYLGFRIGMPTTPKNM